MPTSSNDGAGDQKDPAKQGKAIEEEAVRCSFCHKSRNAVAKLISSPSDHPRAYICDECVWVCATILKEDSGSDTVRLFYSYSHHDEKLRLKLDEQLAALKRRGIIDAWHDRKITGGVEWEPKIDEEIESANIVLLLVSASFIASDYAYGRELEQALQRHKKGTCRVIPVILRPVDWSDTPFSSLQALPKDGKPVTMWKNRESALLDVVRGIQKAVEELRATPVLTKK
jgi:hypothetical protein